MYSRSKLVLAHLFFGIFKFLLSLRVETSAATTAGSFELLLELFVLVLELANKLSLGILIDCGLVLNLLGSISVTESGQGFFVVGAAGTDGANHDCG